MKEAYVIFIKISTMHIKFHVWIKFLCTFHSDCDLLAELVAVVAPLQPQLGRGVLHIGDDLDLRIPKINLASLHLLTFGKAACN